MKTDPCSTPWYAIPGSLKLAGGIAVACTTLFVAIPGMAETVVSGQSDTIIRMGQTVEKKNLYPAYEYLRMSVITDEKDGSTTSFNFGGWARGDMGEKSARDRYVDADVQYGYLSYRGAKNNLLINAGRQFVIEGVAAQRLDGIYVRNDLAAGFAAAAFIGSPVVSEPNFKADDLVFGGRVTQSNYKYYTIGASVLKSFSGSARYREEEGLDLWLHPIKQIDITGRSSYNSVTDGWMEHAYALSYTPIDSLKVSADISNINYKDYFYKVTTSAFGLFNPITNPTGIIDPNEKVLAIGGSVSYSIDKHFTLVGDYKNYNYDIARSAEYYGGKLTYSMPESYAAGISVHRMDGKSDRLNFNEYRVYASKKIGEADLTLDLIDVNYDSGKSMNNVTNAMTIITALSYELSHSLKIGADLDFSRNPDFNREFKGLVKLTYLFDTKHAAGGETTHEK